MRARGLRSVAAVATSALALYCSCSNAGDAADGGGGAGNGSAAGAAGLATGASGGVGGNSAVGGSSGWDANGGSTFGGTAGSAGKSDGACGPPLPSTGWIPDGWIPYTDFSCAQPFYVPPTKELMPEPIQWEPCGAASAVPKGCRSMKVTWPHDWAAISLNPRVEVQPDGRALMLVGRSSYKEQPWDMVLVGNVDGPVESAMLQPRTVEGGTTLIPADLSDGWFAIAVNGGLGIEENALASKRQGVLIGQAGTLHPKLFHVATTLKRYDWGVSSAFVVRWEAPLLRLVLMPLDGQPEFEWLSVAADPEHLQPNRPAMHGSTAVADVNTLLKAAIMAYDPVRGTHPLIRWMGDGQQGAYNVGTDGKTLVWTWGTEHPNAFHAARYSGARRGSSSSRRYAPSVVARWLTSSKRGVGQTWTRTGVAPWSAASRAGTQRASDRQLTAAPSSSTGRLGCNHR